MACVVKLLSARCLLVLSGFAASSLLCECGPLVTRGQLKPGKHNNWQHEDDEEHTYVAHEHVSVHLECPHGYHLVPGDIGGGDAYGRDLQNHVNSMEECKEDCDSREDCLSFEFSPSAMQCYLNKKHLPTEDSVPWKDFMFCSRDLVQVLEIEIGHDGLDMEDELVWAEVQEYDKVRKRLLRKQTKVKKSEELSEDEKEEKLQEIQRDIDDLDEQHQEYRMKHAVRHESTTTTTPPPLKRKQYPKPIFISLEEAQERKIQDRKNWRRTERRRQRQEDFRVRQQAHEDQYGSRRHDRKRVDIDEGVHTIKSEGPYGEGPEDFWDKELHEILGKVHRFKCRIARADFTQEEKDVLLEELELYRQDEHQRIEDAIEAEYRERGPRWGRGFGYGMDDFDDMGLGMGRHGRHGRGGKGHMMLVDDDDDDVGRGKKPKRNKHERRPVNHNEVDENGKPVKKKYLLTTKEYRQLGSVMRERQLMLDLRIKQRERESKGLPIYDPDDIDEL
mmetsp:Transcript_40308/g.92698  ORF Transcript_40308/g.92698 Transcript_40308/m.92698 type:complete len:503 (-) Transcript_40308:47-1555(-)